MKDYNELYHFSHMIANYYKEEDKDNAYPLKHNEFEIIHVDNVEDRCYCYVKTYYMMLTNIDVFCIEEDKITRIHTSKITPHKIEWVKVNEAKNSERDLTSFYKNKVYAISDDFKNDIASGGEIIYATYYYMGDCRYKYNIIVNYPREITAYNVEVKYHLLDATFIICSIRAKDIYLKVQEHPLLENTITTRESQWMPAESVKDYFIKIYRIDVPKMYLGEENGCDVWLVRFFNPIDKKNKIYIHYLKIEGCRCRSVKVYKLILP